ncbi:MAG: SxtJ family membrane protein [Paracoccaceae bacterium]
MRSEQLHENFDHDDKVVVGSDKSFCLVFACFFAIISGFNLGFGSSINNWTYFLCGVTVVFLTVAFTIPQIARPLNILWFRFGLLLHKIVSPVIMGLMFFLTVTPIGLIMRLFGKRPLNLKFEPNAKSYWIHRNPSSLKAGSFKNQF